jgi:hypothetical protein
MKYHHCAVWIDHAKAHLVFFGGAENRSIVIEAATRHGNLHHKAGVVGSGKSGLDPDFIRSIERELGDCHEFVVVGPGVAKLEFIRHIHRYAPRLDEKLAGVETMDHVSDSQLADFAWSYFRAFDRIHKSDNEVVAGLAAHKIP